MSVNFCIKLFCPFSIFFKFYQTIKIINFLKVFSCIRIKCLFFNLFWWILVLFKVNVAFFFVSSLGLIRLPLNFSIRLLLNKRFFSSRIFCSAAKAFPPRQWVLYIPTLILFIKFSCVSLFKLLIHLQPHFAHPFFLYVVIK